VQLNRKERTLIVTIAVNFGLILLKFGLAWLSGSLALKAGAWHSFSDIFVSAIVLAGLILSRREDLQRSHGISRIENAVALIVGLFILYVGVDIFMEVVRGDQPTLTNVPVVIVGALLTIIISFFMARYKIYVGRETDSPSLVADGFHSKLDMYSSIVVVAGLIGYQIGLSSMDRVAAVVVVALVAWAGLEIILGALRALRAGGLAQVLHDNHLPGRADKWMPYVRKAALPVLLITWLSSGLYTVQWNQSGIEKRFGKPVKTDVSPGLHYRLPWPFSTVDIVDVEKVRSVDTPESLMLTGDENLIVMAATAHYAVRSAFDFAYGISDPDKVTALAIESALRQAISRLPVDTVLTEAKAEIQQNTLSTAQTVLDNLGTGVRLITVQLTKAAPSGEVLPAFQDVASAKEDQVTYLNEAYAYQNEIIPESRGQAAGITATAEAYRAGKISSSRGEAKSFSSRLTAFNQNRDLTKTRLYIETMERVLSRVEKMIIDKRINVQSTDLWMLNGRSFGQPLKEGSSK
jgi:membrane protease subunit HflK